VVPGYAFGNLNGLSKLCLNTFDLRLNYLDVLDENKDWYFNVNIAAVHSWLEVL